MMNDECEVIAAFADTRESHKQASPTGRRRFPSAGRENTRLVAGDYRNLMMNVFQ